MRHEARGSKPAARRRAVLEGGGGPANLPERIVTDLSHKQNAQGREQRAGGRGPSEWRPACPNRERINARTSPPPSAARTSFKASSLAHSAGPSSRRSRSRTGRSGRWWARPRRRRPAGAPAAPARRSSNRPAGDPVLLHPARWPVGLRVSSFSATTSKSCAPSSPWSRRGPASPPCTARTRVAHRFRSKVRPLRSASVLCCPSGPVKAMAGAGLGLEATWSAATSPRARGATRAAVAAPSGQAPPLPRSPSPYRQPRGRGRRRAPLRGRGGLFRGDARRGWT